MPHGARNRGSKPPKGSDFEAYDPFNFFAEYGHLSLTNQDVV